MSLNTFIVIRFIHVVLVKCRIENIVMATTTLVSIIHYGCTYMREEVVKHFDGKSWEIILTPS